MKVRDFICMIRSIYDSACVHGIIGRCTEVAGQADSCEHPKFHTGEHDVGRHVRLKRQFRVVQQIDAKGMAKKKK